MAQQLLAMPSGPLLAKMFVGSADAPPRFGSLQFALEAYANTAANTHTVTRVYQSGGLGDSNDFGCQAS